MNHEPPNPRTSVAVNLGQLNPRTSPAAKRDPKMTTTDQTPATASETTSDDRSPNPTKTTVRRFASPGNIASAVFGLGASIVCATLLPLSVYKSLAGVAFIVAVVTIGAIVYRRFLKGDEPTVEETPDGR